MNPTNASMGSLGEPFGEPFGEPLGETLKSAYSRLETNREPYLNRARACSALTIPSLVPPKGHTDQSPLPTPYQSLGSRGVNNLAAKLLMTQLPANQPFFKLAMEDNVREELGAKVGDAEKALNKYERTVMQDLESTATRPAAFEFFKHMSVAGNALTHDSPSGKLMVYGLRQYVCQRSPDGKPLLIILKEDIAPAAVPAAIREIVKDKARASGSADKTLELYTGIRLMGELMVVEQEIMGEKIPGSAGSYPVEQCPWNAARMIIMDGEDYGRSYVEGFIGDLRSLEVLTRAMVQASVAASKIVYLVNPNGMTSEEDIEESEGGDVRTGRAEDVSVLTLEKYNDFSVVETRIGKLTEALSFVFLLNSAIQRQAERVTAEEIRYMANELESTLGGIYSALSQEFQLPLVRSRIASLTRKGKLPQLPKGLVRPMITTGVDAIGRGNDFEKLRTFIAFIAENFGPESVASVVNLQEAAMRAAAGIGIETDGLVKTEDEIADERDAAQQAQMEQSAVAPSINQAGSIMQAGMQQPPQ